MTMPSFQRPVRVLHVVRPAAGGIRAHVLSLLNGLIPAQVENSVAAPPEFLTGLTGCRNLYASVPLDIAPRIAPLEDFRLARRLADVQPQFCDMVHAHGVRAAWVAALAHRRRPFPLLFTAHNIASPSASARLALSFISRRCAQVLAVSEAVAGSLVACGVPHSQIAVVPNGVDIAHFRAGPPRAEARAALSLPETAFVAASAARFSPEKGLDVLLKAGRQRRHMMFAVAGDGPQFALLSQNLPANVTLLGRINDVRPLLAAADVFVVPSRREGQGIAALEAMAAGVPVIASRVGGLAEMLTDGETALLVSPDDPEALAVALSRLQSDSRLRQNLAASALALVESRYSQQTMLDTLTGVYQEARG